MALLLVAACASEPVDGLVDDTASSDSGGGIRLSIDPELVQAVALELAPDRVEDAILVLLDRDEASVPILGLDLQIWSEGGGG